MRNLNTVLRNLCVPVRWIPGHSVGLQVQHLAQFRCNCLKPHQKLLVFARLGASGDKGAQDSAAGRSIPSSVYSTAQHHPRCRRVKLRLRRMHGCCHSGPTFRKRHSASHRFQIVGVLLNRMRSVQTLGVGSGLRHSHAKLLFPSVFASARAEKQLASRPQFGAPSRSTSKALLACSGHVLDSQQKRHTQ